MNQRKDAGAHHGEQRHRFGRSVDRRSPLLPEQKQHRRDQRAGVTDTDPEHEVRDVERPADRLVQPPRADAGRDLIPDGDDAHEQRRERHAERRPPQAGRPALHRRADVARDVAERLVTGDQRRLRECESRQTWPCSPESVFRLQSAVVRVTHDRRYDTRRPEIELFQHAVPSRILSGPS